MTQRGSGKIVRGRFGRQRGPRWTSSLDFLPNSTDPRHRERGTRPRSQRRSWWRYSALWLAAVALGLASSAGVFQGTTKRLLEMGGQSHRAVVYYRRCADARAAGAAPIYVGQPGYRKELDRDRDGIACEPYSGG